MSHVLASKRHRLDICAYDITICNWDDMRHPFSYVKHQPGKILLPLQLQYDGHSEDVEHVSWNLHYPIRQALQLPSKSLQTKEMKIFYLILA